MNKQQILNITGLTEKEFYSRYPDQESFCNDYPEACAQLAINKDDIPTSLSNLNKSFMNIYSNLLLFNQV